MKKILLVIFILLFTKVSKPNGVMSWFALDSVNDSTFILNFHASATFGSSFTISRMEYFVYFDYDSIISVEYCNINDSFYEYSLHYVHTNSPKGDSVKLYCPSPNYILHWNIPQNTIVFSIKYRHNGSSAYQNYIKSHNLFVDTSNDTITVSGTASGGWWLPIIEKEKNVLTTQKQKEKDYNIQVYTLTGSIIYEGKESGFNSGYLASGVYVVRKDYIWKTESRKIYVR
jgi:hypothetical protein